MIESTSTHIDEFAVNGFAVVEDIFSPAEIEEISMAVERIASGRADYLPESELVFEPDANPRRVRNAFRLHQHSQFFLSVAKNPRLVAAVEPLLGRPLRLYSSQLFAKPALVGSAVPHHQDMPYWPFEPPELVSAWIAVDDATLENGCVRYVAGSHKLGLLPHVHSGIQGNSLGLAEDARIKCLPERAVEVRRGSCILHHSLTVHRSEPNRSAHSRRGLIYVYMSPQVRLTDASKLRPGTEFLEVSSPLQFAR